MEPLLGEITMFAGNFAPRGWAQCDGQLLAISQNTSLFSLLGTTYGGDGRSTFALPDLRGRIPVHQGQSPGLTNRVLGEKGGVESVSLTEDQIPAHKHDFKAQAIDGFDDKPEGHVFARNVAGIPLFNRIGTSSNLVQLHSESFSEAGESEPHTNMQPYQAVNFIIALVGIYPSRV